MTSCRCHPFIGFADVGCNTDCDDGSNGDGNDDDKYHNDINCARV